MNITRDIINGSLIISNSSEDNYRNLLFDAKPVIPEYDALTQLDFDYPQVSNKVKYAKRIIDNRFTSYLNELIPNYSTATPERIMYRLRNIKRGLKSSLEQLQSAIDAHSYDLEKLKDKKTRYSADPEYYEMTYIFHYAQQANIRFAVEFQTHFIDFIPEEKKITPALVYNEFLHMPIPDALPVHIGNDIEANRQSAGTAPVKLDIETEKMPTNAQIFVNEVQKYDFTSLPSLSGLSSNQISLLITKTLGNDLPYIVAMLDFLGYPEYLKTKYNHNKEAIYKHIAQALNNKSPRQVKGNFLVLKKGSNEDTSRYSAYQFKDQVEADFNEIARLSR